MLAETGAAHGQRRTGDQQAVFSEELRGPAAAATTLAPEASTRASDKIRVGFIGVGNRGSQLLEGFMAQPDCQVAALCDVYEPYLSRDRAQVDPEILRSVQGYVPRMGEKFGSPVARHKDFRRLLEQKDIDAVVIATPDHWHAIQTIMALEAGKDVYVEKPLTITIPEGRKMVEAQRRSGRVAQVGLHRRSSNLYRQVCDLVRNGKIGRVGVARAYRTSNMFPNGIGKYPDAPPPQGLDWDQWLGPRATRPYRYSIAPYKFRWWQDYSSQMGNWGVHYCDAMRWVLDEEAPVAVTAHGGKYLVMTTARFPTRWKSPSSCLRTPDGVRPVRAVRRPAPAERRDRVLRDARQPVPRGGGARVQDSAFGQGAIPEAGWKDRGRRDRADGRRPDPPAHPQFPRLREVARKCNCDLETGHRSTSFAHLANLALATRSRIEWDPKNERVTNNEQANQMLDYQYRPPWKL